MKAARPVVCPAKAGVCSRRQPYQGKSQSPVAWRAGGRETNLLKPLNSLICGMGASLQAVAQANAEVAPKVSSPGGRARNREGEGRTTRHKPIDAAGRSGGVVSGGTTTRTRRATGEALLVPARKGGSWVGRITGSTGKSADDERVAEGPVVALKRGNARGAKGPCCS